MSGIFGTLAKIVNEMLSGKQARQALNAVILSTILVAVSALLTSFAYRANRGHIDADDNIRILLVVVYILLFFTVWLLLSVFSTREAEDVYSEVRELLKGTWIVTYAANYGVDTDEALLPSRQVVCEIGINEVKKLEFVFKIKDNPVFEDDNGQIIKDIALRRNEDGGYTIFYYYRAGRRIRNEVAEYIVPNHPADDPSLIEVEILGRVCFSRGVAGAPITVMSGNWYDLNGNICRLLSLLERATVARIREESFDGIRLMDVPMHAKYFDADMGSVVFERAGSGSPAPTP